MELTKGYCNYAGDRVQSDWNDLHFTCFWDKVNLRCNLDMRMHEYS